MSATNRKGRQREANDLYVTPVWCLHRFLEKATFLKTAGLHWVEPSAGTGAIIDAIATAPERHIPSEIYWNANELDPQHEQALRNNPFVDEVTIGDFMDFNHCTCSVVIGNPPYSKGFEFVQHAHSIATEYVIFLMRTNFLSSEKRADWMRENTPDVYMLPNRPKFTSSGSGDNSEYGFMVWPIGRPKYTPGKLIMLDSTPKHERLV